MPLLVLVVLFKDKPIVVLPILLAGRVPISEEDSIVDVHAGFVRFSCFVSYDVGVVDVRVLAVLICVFHDAF